MLCVLDNIIFSLQKSGGASVVWQEHIQRLLVEQNIDLKFIEYNNAKENIFRRKIEIPQSLLRTNQKFCFPVLRYLNLHTRQEERHIFHSSHYRINKNRNAINITTVHDFTYEYYVRGLKRLVHSKQKFYSILHSDAIICISESTKNDLLKFIPQIDENRLHVIHNGVNSCFHRISIQNYSIALPFFDYEYILYVGSRHVPYKNFKTVVNVCSMLKKPLVFVGGEALSKSEYCYLKEKLNNRFFHCRGIDSPMLNELYNRALLLLYPSLYEGFGIPVIEAQKAGCPVIAYANSSIPEIMGNSEFALTDISYNAIVEAINYLESPNVRKNEILKGDRNASRFNWDITYKKTTELYKLYFENL